MLWQSAQPDGSTKESREQLLNNLDVHAGMAWNIRTEIPLDGALVCSIYSEHKNGIAVFVEQENGKYKWQGCSYIQRGIDYPLFDSVIADGEVYNFFLLDRDEAAALEVIYTQTESGEQ